MITLIPFAFHPRLAVAQSPRRDRYGGCTLFPRQCATRSAAVVSFPPLLLLHPMKTLQLTMVYTLQLTMVYAELCSRSFVLSSPKYLFQWR